MFSGQDNWSILSRAQYYSHRNQLDLGVEEVKKLHGKPKEVMSEWLERAERSILLQRQVKLVLDHVELQVAHLDSK